MKIRFIGSEKRREQLRGVLDFLQNRPIDGAFVLIEDTEAEAVLTFSADGEEVTLPVTDVLEVESFGHDIYVYTERQTYITHTPLCEMEKRLPKEQFMRVSQSVIVRLSAVVKRTPNLSGRCFVTLTGGRQVTVTRSYYKKFKEVMRYVAK